MDALGVDIGGTKIAGARVTPLGEVVTHASRPTTPDNPERILDAVVEICEELGSSDALPTVGVAVAAFLDRDRETLLFSPNIAWQNFPLKAEVEKRLGVPVVLENDANAAGWGEFRFGAARDVQSMIMLTIGTGVGGALVDDGRLLVGGFGMAAELGHIIIEPGGRLCGCGNYGCLEQYASGTALMRDARERLDDESLTQAAVTDLLREGNAHALEALDGVARAMGRGIASLVAVTDPELIVIGGGVASAGDLLLNPIRESFLDTYGAGARRPVTSIVAATMGNTAGVVGAADLARARITSGA
ncbi:MAG TPA: ROK family protein [Pontimonas sp.]|nr:ROK family protein [Pontimonas sp.]